MKLRMMTAGFAALVLLSATSAAVAAVKDRTAPQSDEAIVKSVTHEIRMYPNYTIWDDISFRVSGGNVELLGAVNQPYKKSDLERLVREVPGVTSITNGIRVLPLSPNDDRLRLQVARAIYGDPAFTRYAIQGLPPIHIVVDNGHVTLSGVVGSALDKQLAGVRASSAGLSFGPVTNNLMVENGSKKRA